MKISVALYLVLSFMFVTIQASADSPFPERPEFLRVAVGPAGRLLAITTNGMYRTADGGEHWVRTFQSGADRLVHRGGNVFVITYEGKRYRTGDFGVTWIDDGLVDDTHLTAVLESETPDGTFLFCNQGILQVSDDIGKSWREVRRNGQCKMATANADVIYVVDNGLIYRSDNRGENWYSVPLISKLPKLGNIEVDRRGVLYSQIENEPGFYLSLDGGATWNHEMFGLPPDGAPRIYRVRSDAVYILVGAQTRIQKTSFYRSVDGKSITKMNLNYPWYWDIQADDCGAIYVATGDFIYKSMDQGSSWRPLGRAGIYW
jgi:hypothetical protein